MGLNPSNVRYDGVESLPTLGDPPFTAERRDIAEAELKAVGIKPIPDKGRIVKVYKPGSRSQAAQSMGIWMPSLASKDDEMDQRVFQATGNAFGWSFRRAWYYWVCTSNTNRDNVPEVKAREFNDKWGDQVRVRGFAGGTTVEGDVDMYHVDSPAGLQALVDLIRGSK